jgi:CBS domain-containing protein
VLSDKIGTLAALTEPVTVEIGTPVSDLLQQIRRHKVGCVLVTEGDRLAGIITERDILLKVVARNVPFTEPVEKFMTSKPVVLGPEKTVGDAVKIMNEMNFRHVPVVHADGRAHGIVSIKDVITLVAESFPQHVLNLPPRPHQKMAQRDGG